MNMDFNDVAKGAAAVANCHARGPEWVAAQVADFGVGTALHNLPKSAGVIAGLVSTPDVAAPKVGFNPGGMEI